MKLTRKNLLAWLWRITATAKVEELSRPWPAYEPLSYRRRDEAAEAAAAYKRKAGR